MFHIYTPKWLLYVLITLYIVTISLTLIGWYNLSGKLAFYQIFLCIVIYAIIYLILFMNIEEFYSRK